MPRSHAVHPLGLDLPCLWGREAGPDPVWWRAVASEPHHVWDLDCMDIPGLPQSPAAPVFLALLALWRPAQWSPFMASVQDGRPLGMPASQ